MTWNYIPSFTEWLKPEKDGMLSFSLIMLFPSESSSAEVCPSFCELDLSKKYMFQLYIGQFTQGQDRLHTNKIKLLEKVASL